MVDEEYSLIAMLKMQAHYEGYDTAYPRQIVIF